MGKTIGIDLGTTKCTVSVLENGKPVIIRSAEGGTTTPSYIAESRSGETLVGQRARGQAKINPFKTLFGVKRLIGRRYLDEKNTAGQLNKEVAQMKSAVNFDIVAGKNGDAHVKLGERTMSPQEVASVILAKLKRDAEKYLGEDVTDAVITVPAYFDDSQREATRQAAAIAGLNAKRIINEPTAAALAYGLDKKREGYFAVYDFGGGTFDISILEAIHAGTDENGNDLGITFEVLSTDGDTFLGGENIDEAIAHYIIEDMKLANPDMDIDLNDAATRRKYAGELQAIREQAENLKIQLSSASESGSADAYVTLGEWAHDFILSRRKFEELAGNIIQKTLEPCNKALKAAGLSAADIDEVILVGQSSRIPLVQQEVEKLFGRAPRCDVALDEIVAAGAAVQGGILDGVVNHITLTDVIPLSLGVRTAGNVMSKLIEANSAIPCTTSKIYTNNEDNQSSVTINIFQGERPTATDNRYLGELTLDLPYSRLNPAKAGTADIEVTFSVDQNGALSVKAKDLKSNNEVNATFKANGGLDEAEIEKLKQEAAANAAFDKVLVETNTLLTEAREDQQTASFKQAPETLQKTFKDAVDGLVAARTSRDLKQLNDSIEKFTQARSDFAAHFNAQNNTANDDTAEDAPATPKNNGTDGPQL